MESKVRDLGLTTGIRVPCLIQGDPGARPVLLLHAWGESRGSFDRLLPLLTGFRILAPDLRGQGGADKPTSGYSFSDQTQDVVAILDALGIEKAFVVGSSSGGYVAQQVAVTTPDRVAGLVLVGAPLSLHGRAPFADDVEQLSNPIAENWVRDFLSWFPFQRDVPTWFIEDRIRDGVTMSVHAWKGIMHGYGAAMPPTEAGPIRSPTLILWGDHDRLLPWKDQQTLASRIRGAALKVYPDVGHLVLWECPELVARDAKVFFDSLPLPGHPVL
ncbi:alpha/beta fold hydrolase [Arthrobacter sp. B0490]|uniref:alpha/beta fold hydrolase n=1 Tax=Arthrobacter sp. B0490 TaxID=2058891 RepID=UPI000CE56267|nr:alpha/beta hydrolase [Arthrobacter sp. B0490]